jgi:hypothetical protein
MRWIRRVGVPCALVPFASARTLALAGPRGVASRLPMTWRDYFFAHRGDAGRLQLFVYFRVSVRSRLRWSPSRAVVFVPVCANWRGLMRAVER